MGRENENLMKQRRHQYAQASRELAYLQRRSARGELTPGQKSRLEMLKVKVRNFKRLAMI